MADRSPVPRIKRSSLGSSMGSKHRLSCGLKRGWYYACGLVSSPAMACVRDATTRGWNMHERGDPCWQTVFVLLANGSLSELSWHYC